MLLPESAMRRTRVPLQTLSSTPSLPTNESPSATLETIKKSLTSSCSRTTGKPATELPPASDVPFSKRATLAVSSGLQGRSQRVTLREALHL